MNTWTDFLDAVEKMRAAQKEYFRSRYPSALSAAKQREADIDKAIKAIRQRQAEKINPWLLGEVE